MMIPNLASALALASSSPAKECNSREGVSDMIFLSHAILLAGKACEFAMSLSP